MGNDSGELGHNIMDHHFKAGAVANFDGFDDKYYKGRRPNGLYIPRFRNIGGKTDQKDLQTRVWISRWGPAEAIGRKPWQNWDMEPNLKKLY